jgi:hypothetical protein
LATPIAGNATTHRDRPMIRGAFRRTLHRTVFVVAMASAVVTMLNATAHALTYATAGELRDDCAAIPRMLRGERSALTAAGECIAFIDGALGFAHAYALEHQMPLLCIPARVTTVELAGLYVQSIDSLPGTRADPATVALYRVLNAAFPCTT